MTKLSCAELTPLTEYRLKPFAQYRDDFTVAFLQEPGVTRIIEVDAPWQIECLDILGSWESERDSLHKLLESHPSVTSQEVKNFLSHLDEAGVLAYVTPPTLLPLADQQRYTSNLGFFEIFEETSSFNRHDFQEQLSTLHVVQLGLGGIGSSIVFNLAGLGIGHLTLVDDDEVELKNLSRQFVYQEVDIGKQKIDIARDRISAFNRSICVDTVQNRIADVEQLRDIIRGADLVISVIDQPSTIGRTVSDACVLEGIPLVKGGTFITTGIYYSIEPGVSACLCCQELALEEEFIRRPDVPNVLTNRVIAPAAGLMGNLVVWEALRYLLPIAPPISAGRTTRINFLNGTIQTDPEWPKRHDCQICAQSPSWEDEDDEKTNSSVAKQTVDLHPITVLEEDNDYLIGDVTSGSFISVPESGVIALRSLLNGDTIGTAEMKASRAVGYAVDVSEFVEQLQELGFVRRAGEDSGSENRRRLHELIPKRLAQAFFNRFTWTVYGFAFLTSIFILVREPVLMPRSEDLLIWNNFPAVILTYIAIVAFLVSGHELWHLMAAKSIGVPAYLSISRRMFIPVAQADVSRVWAVPANQRYSPILAGLAHDFTWLAIALGTRFAWTQGIPVSPVIYQLAGVIVLSLSYSIVFQFLVFLRTDLYAFLVTVFRCRNLYRVNLLSLKQFLKPLKMFPLTPEEQQELETAHDNDIRALSWFTPIYLVGLFCLGLFLSRIFFPNLSIIIAWGYRSLFDLPFGSGIFWQNAFVAVFILLQYLVPLLLLVFVPIRLAWQALQKRAI